MIVALPLADLAFGSGIPALAVGAGEVVLSKIDLGDSPGVAREVVDRFGLYSGVSAARRWGTSPEARDLCRDSQFPYRVAKADGYVLMRPHGWS